MQKFINLLGEFLVDFMGRGCSCTMDSAYMGQLLAQVARKVWKVNVVGTAQIESCGPDPAFVKEIRKAIKVRFYESVFFITNGYHFVRPFGETTILLLPYQTTIRQDCQRRAMGSSAG